MSLAVHPLDALESALQAERRALLEHDVDALLRSTQAKLEALADAERTAGAADMAARLGAARTQPRQRGAAGASSPRGGVDAAAPRAQRGQRRVQRRRLRQRADPIQVAGQRMNMDAAPSSLWSDDAIWAASTVRFPVAVPRRRPAVHAANPAALALAREAGARQRPGIAGGDDVRPGLGRIGPAWPLARRGASADGIAADAGDPLRPCPAQRSLLHGGAGHQRARRAAAAIRGVAAHGRPPGQRAGAAAAVGEDGLDRPARRRRRPRDQQPDRLRRLQPRHPAGLRRRRCWRWCRSTTRRCSPKTRLRAATSCCRRDSGWTSTTSSATCPTC